MGSVEISYCSLGGRTAVDVEELGRGVPARLADRRQTPGAQQRRVAVLRILDERLDRGLLTGLVERVDGQLHAHRDLATGDRGVVRLLVDLRLPGLLVGVDVLRERERDPVLVAVDDPLVDHGRGDVRAGGPDAPVLVQAVQQREVHNNGEQHDHHRPQCQSGEPR